MQRRWRFLIILIILTVAAAWCGTQVVAENAKPRDKTRERTHTERRRDSTPPKARRSEERQSQRHQSGRDSKARPERRQRESSDRDDAPHRHPQPGANVDRDKDRDRGQDIDRDRLRRRDAERRHPRPDGRYDRDRHRDWDRYHWRNWNHRQRWDRDRFPRSYAGRGRFNGCRYRGWYFGPHHRLWYLDRSTWRLFYWPYPYAPRLGCGWYWVPTDRSPFSGDRDDEYWDYTDYRYVYLCFD